MRSEASARGRPWGRLGLALLCLGSGLAVLATGGVAFPGRDIASKVVSAPRVKAMGPEVVVRVPWGNGPSALGRLDGDEGASEGPMSFALAADGTVWFLDQTRFRLARFGPAGALLQEMPLPADTFQDFEVMPDGSFVLLDRLAHRTMVVLDASGRFLRSVPVEGPGIPEGGTVTAMWADGSGVWLEHLHTERVRVLDASLQPCQREVVRGRPFRQGTELLGARDGRGSVTIWTEDRLRGQGSRAIVSASHEVARIIWLQADDAGDVHAVFHLLEFDGTDPTRVTHEEVIGIRYDGNLQERGVWTSPWVIREWEQFREVRVGQDGTIHQMGFEDGGVVVARWRWLS